MCSRALYRNVEVLNFSSECVSIEPEELGCLDLIPLGFFQGQRNRGRSTAEMSIG